MKQVLHLLKEKKYPCHLDFKPCDKLLIQISHLQTYHLKDDMAAGKWRVFFTKLM